MISAEKWWSVMGNYNLTIFPVQIILYVFSLLITIYFFMKPGRVISTVIKIYFTLSFSWIGIVLFFILGKDLKLYIPQVILFLSLSALFFIDIFRKRIVFRLQDKKSIRVLAVIGFILVFVYPLIGLLVGHTYPHMLLPGSFPCPTAALALLFLTMALPHVTRLSYFLLLFWAIPFPILIQIPQFGVFEDAVMLLVGLYSLILFVINWRKIKGGWII
jgi:hypothetical protein